ncbi:unnamed protein product [Schistosoma curassoni]|uniref:SWIM-type domain-containing protein n=1 Tax=Schistosoma curassoni TaxID=6186 RepID=A0A183KDS5_9TREM|nr:unnamed protein product [Schistosoma curassoni]
MSFRTLLNEFTSFAAKIVAVNYKRVRTMRHGFIEGEYTWFYDKGMMYVVDTSRARCACERFNDYLMTCGHILYAHFKDLIRGGSDDLLKKFTNSYHSIHALSEPLASNNNNNNNLFSNNNSRKEEQEGSNQYQPTRAQKAKAQAEYTEVNKQVKRSIRTEKRKYVEHLAMMIEKAAREGNMRQLYDTTNNLAGNYRKPERLVKSEEGKVITNIGEQQNRPPNRCCPPTIEETSMAIRQIKSGKARGPDNIPAEALKADEVITAKILHILFNKIWDEEQVPTDWKEGHLIEILKKGDLNKCENYRRITLLSIPGKVFNRVLLNRTKDSVDAQLRDRQAGLSNDQSYADQITTLRIIVEQSIEYAGEDNQCSGSLSSSRSQHTQMEKQDSPIQTTCTNQITLDGEDLEDVKTPIYMGSIIDEYGGPGE